MTSSELSKLFFPFSNIRPSQDELITKVDQVLQHKQNLIVHAPTGLGKTAAMLGPALKHAIKNGLTIFFLTSRHTQHLIAIETLREIKNKYNLDIITTDIIGKKWMCAVPGIERLYSGEFSDYCKSVREEGKCEFYLNTKKKAKLTPKAKKVLKELKQISPTHSEKLIKICAENKLCPYEVATALAKESRVVIADYYYIFNPQIRDTFFKKTANDLEKSIIIIDEGHNLPFRLRDLMTQRLSTFILDRAISEARKFGYQETQSNLKQIKSIIVEVGDGLANRERLTTKKAFINSIEEFSDFNQLIADLVFIADDIRETEKQSYIGSVAKFLEAWLGPDTGFVRIISHKQLKKPLLTLSYRCLDPSLISKQVIDNAYSTIIMSGTLTPLEMYKDILGFEQAEMKEYKSPFPEKNKLTMIIPETTTKFTERSPQQFKRIGEICADIANTIPGNTIIYFPSYSLRDEVDKTFTKLCRKTTFLEYPKLSKSEKRDFLDKFKSYSEQGAVMLAVVSGSFGEGIDLPGDLLKAAVVVGLPLQVPDLETKALIEYYDEKFSKGWDYGYIFPAMNKTMQNAGRVIRSETDTGAIIFLDERYSWQHYSRCFPETWDIVVTKLYQERLEEFFR